MKSYEIPQWNHMKSHENPVDIPWASPNLIDIPIFCLGPPQPPTSAAQQQVFLPVAGRAALYRSQNIGFGRRLGHWPRFWEALKNRSSWMDLVIWSIYLPTYLIYKSIYLSIHPSIHLCISTCMLKILNLNPISYSGYVTISIHIWLNYAEL